ncbi:MAG: hypothetical protein R3C27_00050 [Hyphomonadaceae bacterium]
MTSAWLPWAIVALMFVTSAWALTQTPDDARLPMQWGIRGDVNWRAPRAVALLFSPALAILTLGFLYWLAGPDLAELGWLPVFIAAIFAATHGAYVFFALRDVNAHNNRGRG